MKDPRLRARFGQIFKWQSRAHGFFLMHPKLPYNELMVSSMTIHVSEVFEML